MRVLYERTREGQLRIEVEADWMTPERAAPLIRSLEAALTPQVVIGDASLVPEGVPGARDPITLNGDDHRVEIRERSGACVYHGYVSETMGRELLDICEGRQLERVAALMEKVEAYDRALVNLAQDLRTARQPDFANVVAAIQQGEWPSHE